MTMQIKAKVISTSLEATFSDVICASVCSPALSVFNGGCTRMNGWIEPLSFSIVGAALLLSLIGLWFTVIIPGIDRWSRHFFIYYFMIF